MTASIDNLVLFQFCFFKVFLYAYLKYSNGEITNVQELQMNQYTIKNVH